MATSTTSGTGAAPAGHLVHRPVRAHPRPLPATGLTVAAPPTVGSSASSLAGWLQYLVPLLGSAGSVGFLFAVPGPRPAWLVVAVAGTAVASVGLGLGLRLVERRTARRARRRERARYLAHLDQVAAQAGQRASGQLAVADHLHPDPPRLWALVNRADRLWERRPTDDDFLTVRVGRGPVPLTTPVRLDASGGPLVEHDPELQLAAEDLVDRARSLPDAPVAVPLRPLGVLALTGPAERTRALARSMVCQLAAFHAPDDLRILAAFPPSASPGWDWLKWLPHARDPTPDRHGGPPSCLLAETAAGLSDLLDRQVRPRLATSGTAGGHGGPGATGGERGGRHLPHLVAVLDLEQRPAGAVPDGAALDELLERAPAIGVTVVWLAEDTAAEPSELAARIRLDATGTASFEETTHGGRLVPGIRADLGGLAFCEAIARRMAPLRLDRRPTPAGQTGPVRLLDLLDLLDLGDPGAGRGAPGAGCGDPVVGPGARDGRLRSRPRSKLLRVPVGAMPGGGPLVLDLKEAAEGGIGPHGLVVGATGSGKSELLRTIVAGLAATHPPEQLAFVLVDFKGGAAFAELAPLPQVAGLITNLHADLAMIDRAMAALQGELARRQRLLHLAGNQPDIRAYTARREADPRLEPLPHLLVVVDEFGELLTVRPELLDLFTAIGRVGRSLGMHLLLASQRLGEGRLHGLDGHLRYRICLRTFSAAESTAVLGVPDAFHLPPAPGTALLKVDATPPVRFTAASISTTRPPAPGSEPLAGGAVRASLPVVPFTATRPAGRPTRKAAPGAEGDEPSFPPGTGPHGNGRPTDLEVLVAGVAGAGPPVHQVWLPPLPATIPLDGLLDMAEPAWLRVPVGIVDRPVGQTQEPLVLDLSGGAGHLAVVGAPRTGKSTLLCTVVAALAATHRPDGLHVYAVDHGGGLLHRLGDLPHVGAVCGPREPERVLRLVRELRRLVAERERQFRDLGIDTMTSWHELRRAGFDLGEYGEVVLVVDNWDALVRELPELEAAIGELAAIGLHHGVHLVLAANRWAELRPGLRDNLGGRLELRLNDPLESELGRTAAAALPDMPGRGLTQSGLQFQAALPGPARAVLDRARTAPGPAVAPPLRLLPALVGAGSLPAACPGQPPGVPFAVEEHRLEPVWLDLFEGPPHLLVLGDAGCGKSSLLRLLATGLAARHPPQDVAILLVDLRRGLLDLAALPNLVGYAATTSALGGAVDRLHRRLTGRLGAGLDDRPAPPDPQLAAWPSSPVEPGAPTRVDGAPAAPVPVAPLIPCLPPVVGTPTREGPRYVVLVDDYDLLPTEAGSPLLPLLDLVGQGRELGFHLVLARSVAGAARAGFEPVFQRLRELGGSGLIMRGDPGEGPLLAGQKAADLPPGRGFLVRPRQPPTLVQVAYSRPPAHPGGSSVPHRDRLPAGRGQGASRSDETWPGNG